MLKIFNRKQGAKIAKSIKSRANAPKRLKW
jgi:hypothetical protein